MKIFIIGMLVLAVIQVGGCVSSSDYQELEDYSNNLSGLLSEANETIEKVTGEYETLKNENKLLKDKVKLLETNTQPKHFENRTAIEEWLKITPKLGMSKDVEEWYQYALYYQKKAMEHGYIVSVGSWETEDGLTVWCEMLTVDGYVFFFDPDTCELIDAFLRIDLNAVEELADKALGDLL